MLKSLGGLLASAILTVSPAAADSAWKPNRPIEFVAAAGPGGGTDMFARVVQAAMTQNKLVEVPIVVTNKAGGSGAETFVYAKTNPGDPYKLYFGAVDAYVLPLGNKLNYDSTKDLTPVAAMVFDPLLLWVNPEASGIEDVKGFIAAAKEKPGAVRVGGAKSKDVDHTLVTLIEYATDTKLTFVPFKSGSETATQLAGGHIEANVNNPSESVEQWKAGVQKPLCAFEDERLPDKNIIADGMSWHDIPTCREAGIDIKNAGIDIKAYAQPRTVWMAADVPPEALAFYVEQLKKAAASPEFVAYRERGMQVPRMMTGAELDAFIAQDRANFATIFKRNDWLRAADQ